jgi:hypothetical protein
VKKFMNGWLQDVSASENSVGPEFLDTLGIPLLQGRDISESDIAATPAVVLVNETFRTRFLKNGALGHRIGGLPGAEIVGVVKDKKYARIRETGFPAVYYPLAQTGMLGQITVEVRSVGDPIALLPAMREAVRELDPNLPLQKPMTEAAQFAESYVTPMLFARLALGTPRESVVWMIASEILLLPGLGVGLGLPLSLAVPRFLRAQLYQLRDLDVSSFAVAFSLTFLVAIAAVVPAWRAARVDPMVALRYE